MDQTVRVWAYDAVTEAAPASPEVRDDATATSSAVQSEVLHEAAAPAPVPAPPAAILRLASPVHALAWSADGAFLLAGGDQGAPAAWRATASGYDAMAPPAGQGHAAPVVQVAIAPDGTCCPRPSAGINPSVGPCRAAAAADEDDPRPRVPGPKFRRTRPLRAVRKEKIRIEHAGATASHDGTCRTWLLDGDDRKLAHVASCARTGGRIVGCAFDGAALGLDASGRRRARARLATVTADAAIRVWPAAPAAVKRAERVAADAALGDDAALRSHVLGGLLAGGDLCGN